SVEVPRQKIEPNTKRTASKNSMGRLGKKAPHPATFVGLEVRNNDVTEARGIEHLGNRKTNVVVHGKGTGVNQRWFVIVDQELIEANPFLSSIGADAVDAASQMIYARHDETSVSN